MRKTIACPQGGSACHVQCNGMGACAQVTIACGDGPCTVDCQNGGCDPGSTIVDCGKGSCSVTCSGSAGPQQVTPGAGACAPPDVAASCAAP